MAFYTYGININSLRKNTPESILWTIARLHDAGYESFMVGGCVRDLLLGRTPNDYDLTTNATPEQIIEVFEKTDRRVVYENNFGTVGIINKNLGHDDVGYEVEITPYRTEGSYTDNRRPDQVLCSDSIREDVKRRDFTINAMAYDPITESFVDDYGGILDLENKIIRTVLDPKERFGEDALRIMRAVRFAAQLGFTMERQTQEALIALSESLSAISSERIRDEFMKLVDSAFAKKGMEDLLEYNLLPYIAPEFLSGVGCDQGGIHSFDVWTHLIKSLEHATVKNYPLYVKVAALFHDIGKPESRRASTVPGKKKWTFYGHEVIGARIVKKRLGELKLPKEFIKKVELLVRYHMFFSDPEAITHSAVRRMVRNVGRELIWNLMDVRTCDRIGTGRPKEKPYRLRQYHAMIEEVMRDPVSVKMLKLNGDIMIGEMGMNPGRRMGWMLHAMLEEVLDDPKRNTREYLEEKARFYETLSDADLQSLGDAGRGKKDEIESQEVKKLHRKHKVK